ncbi:MAG: WYL domain-containing protein [Acidimicrobiales bacterium]|nr:WYL domain-containing protein [Acidimicrobiales bacterium]
MSTRMTSGARLARLLAVIPWVAAQDGPLLTEVAERFDYPYERLTADLQEVVMFVGVYPFSPDQLIEVVVDDGRVWISYADWFSKPLKLTPDQALAMMAAGQSMLDIVGESEDNTTDGPLLRGLTKLGAAVGASAAAPVEVRLGRAADDVLATLRAAVSEHQVVEMEYYVYSRDEFTRRVVEPHRFFANAGQWYISSYCRLAEADRVFRVDRIRSVDPTGETFVHEGESGPLPPIYDPAADDPRVVLEIDDTLEWVLQQFPHDEATRRDEGGWTITMAVSATPWLERLMVQLGPHARIVGGDAEPIDVAAVAGRVLARYRQEARGG